MLAGRVTSIAPSAATEEDAQSTVLVRCSLEGDSPVLRTSMSGHARIYTGSRSAGAVLRDWSLGLLRTEFWW